MRIIERYMLKGFLVSFLYSLIVFTLFYIVVDFLLGLLEDVVEVGTPMGKVLLYYLHLTPLILVRICPLSVLLSALMRMGDLCRHNELTAIRAAGISPRRAFSSLIIVAFIIGLLSMALNEQAVPLSREANRIRMEWEGKEKHSFRNLHFRSSERHIFLIIRSYDTVEKKMEGASITECRPDGTLRWRIYSDDVKWVGGKWMASRGILNRYDEGGNWIGDEPIAQKEIPIREKPDDIVRGGKLPEEMGISELKAYIQQLQSWGDDSRGEKVNFHSRMSLPFLSCIMAILAFPFALRLRRGGMIIGFGLSAALGMAFYMVDALGKLLGETVLPPLAGAWLGNFVFLCISLILFSKVK